MVKIKEADDIQRACDLLHTREVYMESQDVMELIRCSIANGEMKEVNKMLDENKEVINELTSYNGTLLHEAVRYNQMELAGRLIDMGIDINVKCPGSVFKGTALNMADNVVMAQFLMDKGLKPDLSLENFRDNPISSKIIYDNLEMFLFWFHYEYSLMDSEKQIQLEKTIKSWADTYESREILQYLNKNKKSRKKLRKKLKNKEVLAEFEMQLLNITKDIYSFITKNHCEVYAFSMVCVNTFDYVYFVANKEDYYNEVKDNSKVDYNKRYNEEEWGIAVEKMDCLNTLSKLLNDIILQWGQEDGEEHIVNICVNVLQKLRDERYFPEDVSINLHIWEYFSDEDMMEMYFHFNGENRANEYRKFLLNS